MFNTCYCPKRLAYYSITDTPKYVPLKCTSIQTLYNINPRVPSNSAIFYVPDFDQTFLTVFYVLLTSSSLSHIWRNNASIQTVNRHLKSILLLIISQNVFQVAACYMYSMLYIRIVWIRQNLLVLYLPQNFTIIRLSELLQALVTS